MSPEHWIVIATIGALALVIVVWFLAISRIPSAAEALAAGDKVKLIVIVGVVVASSCLALLKAIPGEHIITIFGTILGFVFGQSTAQKKGSAGTGAL
ncbi:MAG: hypothetical protein PVJ57_17230 [Phycisphaerae bacterium]|jgi:hypothetical protein